MILCLQSRAAGQTLQTADFEVDDKFLNDLQRRVIDWFNGDFRKVVPVSVWVKLLFR